MQAFTIIFSTGTVLALIQAGCSTTRPHSTQAGNASNVTQGQSNSDRSQEVLARVTRIVAEVLTLKPGEVDADMPLTKQKNAADELDVVEIVLRVEEAYNIEIKDEELGGTLEEVNDDLTVRRLVDIVAKRRPANK